jgi:acetyltransferase-like isoleucine patch superfamily enzyme
MDNRVSKGDKFSIYWRAGIKALRGIFKKPFLKHSDGLLLIGKGVQITHGKHIACGKRVKFEDYAEIHGLCRDGLIFGNDVTIGRSVMIRPSSYYGGDLGKGLVIGDNSSIGPDAYVGCSGKIVIGKNVMFGPKCSLFAENHNFSDENTTIKSQGVNQKGIVIEDDCWIGSNVIILDGVHIGRGCVIGGGTLLSRDVPAGTVVIDKRNKSTRMRYHNE